MPSTDKLVLVLLIASIVSTEAFVAPANRLAVVSSGPPVCVAFRPAQLSEKKKDDGVIELADDDDEAEDAEPKKAVAPFLSQGEISEEAMEMDLSDPKQARVMLYIILSLLPVLFLIPLMLGSRDLIPAEALPPVQL